MTRTADEAELLQQIAAYAGAINRHQNSSYNSTRARSQPYNKSATAPIAKSRTSRNKTLVFTSPLCSNTDTSTWISSRDRGHMTLTNSAAYTATTASKLQRIDETRALRRTERLRQKEAKEAERLKYLASKTLEHDGVTYLLNKNATLLIRTSLDDVETRPTPQRTMISGIEFLKSPKSDNLFRKSSIKLRSKRTKRDDRAKKFCKFFTRSGKYRDKLVIVFLHIDYLVGICTNAKSCSYKHDINHLALCSRFLTPQGCVFASCNLSHNPVAENTPACLHYLRGACNKDDCRYMHTDVEADALVCSDFARNGYCSKGANCAAKHVRECPSFSNSGACKAEKCRLPHVARANKKEATTTKIEDETSGSDSDTSTDSYESEDFDENAFNDYVKL